MADFRQKEIGGAQQDDLFAERPVQTKPKPERKHGMDEDAARYYLGNYVRDFSELKTWPWEKHLVEKLHTYSFPMLLRFITDPREVDDWKAKLKCECDRLDAATQWAA